MPFVWGQNLPHIFKKLLSADDTMGINFTSGLFVKTVISDKGILHCENDPRHCNIICTGLSSKINQPASGNSAINYCFLIPDWAVFFNLLFASSCCVWRVNYILQTDVGCVLLHSKLYNLSTQKSSPINYAHTYSHILYVHVWRHLF